MRSTRTLLTALILTSTALVVVCGGSGGSTPTTPTTTTPPSAPTPPPSIPTDLSPSLMAMLQGLAAYITQALQTLASVPPVLEDFSTSRSRRR